MKPSQLVSTKKAQELLELHPELIETLGAEKNPPVLLWLVLTNAYWLAASEAGAYERPNKRMLKLRTDFISGPSIKLESDSEGAKQRLLVTM